MAGNKKKSEGKTGIVKFVTDFRKSLSEEPQWVRVLVSGFALFYGLIIILMVVRLFVATAEDRKHFFTSTGWNEWGDSFGGLIGPAMAFLGAILVYRGFQKQIEANNLVSAANELASNARKEDVFSDFLKYHMEKIERKFDSFIVKTPHGRTFDSTLNFFSALRDQPDFNQASASFEPHKEQVKEFTAFMVLCNFFATTLHQYAQQNLSDYSRSLLVTYVVEFKTFLEMKVEVLVTRINTIPELSEVDLPARNYLEPFAVNGIHLHGNIIGLNQIDVNPGGFVAGWGKR